jgi:hypothetical protein
MITLKRFLQKSIFVAMSQYRNAVASGWVRDLGPQNQAHPTLPRYGTDFIATRMVTFAKASKAYRTSCADWWAFCEWSRLQITVREI